MKSKINIVAITFMFLIFAVSCKQKKAADTPVSGMEQPTNIKLSKAQMQLANIIVDSVKENTISNEIIFSGKLVVNENTNKVISSKVAGRIDKLYYKKTGDLINKGDILYEIYSEDLQSAQKEYLLALEKQKKLGTTANDFSQIIDAAENKLLLWGMSSGQIEQLKNTATIKNTVPVYSTVSGYIQDINISEGDYLMAGSTVFKLSDNSTLWIEAQAYSDEIEYIRESTPITYTISSFPDEELKGTISFVNPELEKDSKINLIRVEILNTANEYKPGMMAEVKLRTNEKKAVTVSVNAVLVNSNGSTVWVQNPDSTFEVRMVTTGIRNSDEVEITYGLKENERVVTSGAYLLNSEYILKNGSDPMAGMKM
jgi:membrane fusion protein, copper/silver efflux system